QGEGAQAGRAAVFCRFSGCNLWNGREEDREKARCQFCDTDFLGTDGPGGGRFGSAEQLVAQIASTWRGSRAPRRRPFVVVPGGGAGLEVDEEVLGVLAEGGFERAIETNGTLPLPEGLDWVCVSPKAGTELLITRGHELKVVYPQGSLRPEDLAHLEFTH